MRRVISTTLRSIAVLASLLSVNLALAQQQEAINIQGTAAQAAEDRILAILKTPFSGATRHTTLSEALAGIRQSTGLPIHLDAKALEDASIAVDSPVNCDVSGVTLHSALDMILNQLDLTWVIDDECLLVTTSDKARNCLVSKVYPVLDLVTVRNAAGSLATNYQPLLQTITGTIAPTDWDEVGGPGAITPFGPSGAIVVNQTREVHEQLAKLLTALRKARDVQHVDRAPSEVGRHGVRRARQPQPIESAEPSRYVVVPNAAWSLPQVHE